MDEAMGAFQSVCSSADHSAVVEMVMILQASYLTTDIQQHHQDKNIKRLPLNYKRIRISSHVFSLPLIRCFLNGLYTDVVWLFKVENLNLLLQSSPHSKHILAICIWYMMSRNKYACSLLTLQQECEQESQHMCTAGTLRYSSDYSLLKPSLTTSVFIPLLLFTSLNHSYLVWFSFTH